MAGYWLHQPEPTIAGHGEHKVLYYRCPMHPSYKSDKPGSAPCCGMDLEPVYADGGGAPTAGTGGRALGAVQVSVEKQQLIGMKTAKVMRSSNHYGLRVLGRVAADETRVHRVTALADGVIREVGAFTTGTIVQKDDLLAKYFVSSQEVYSAIQSYFLSMNSVDQRIALMPNTATVDQLKAQIRLSQELLQSFGITAKQLEEMSITRVATRDIQFRSPVTGLILLREAALGQRLERGSEIFRIADISKVWVLADLFENESGMMRPGASARVRYQGRTYSASVSSSNQFDAESRVLKVRLELANPGLILKPGMFVEVEMDVAQPDAITLPADAILDSGRRRVVFVSRGGGNFEPREVTTGARYGDRVQVVNGLTEGEEVVVSGLFLLDSESRLQTAAQGAPVPMAPVAAMTQPKTGKTLAGSTVDPVCGMPVNASTAAYHSGHGGTITYFCSKDCKDKFDSNPSKFASKM